MKTIIMPDGQTFNLEYAVFDYNGTLAQDGKISVEVKQLLTELTAHITVVVITADTFGLVRTELSGIPHLEIHIISPGHEDLQKAAFVKKCGGSNTICFGNGANDGAMFDESCLAIGIIGPEGACRATMDKADILVNTPQAAINLLLKPKRLIATLRR